MQCIDRAEFETDVVFWLGWNVKFWRVDRGALAYLLANLETCDAFTVARLF